MVLICDHVEFSILRTEFRIYDQKKHNVYRNPRHILRNHFSFYYKTDFFSFHNKFKKETLNREIMSNIDIEIHLRNNV